MAHIVDSKIISNDTQLEPISWELIVENHIFNFCVGEHLSTKFHMDQKMSKNIPHLFNPVAERGKI